MPSTSDVAQFVILSPVQFAALLDLSAEDAPYLSLAPVRLPTAWVTAWNNKIGPREFTPADVAMLTGTTLHCIYQRMKSDATPRLRARATSTGKNWAPRIAPADLVQFLREANAERGITPVLSETPGEAARRGIRDRADALRACDGK